MKLLCKDGSESDSDGDQVFAIQAIRARNQKSTRIETGLGSSLCSALILTRAGGDGPRLTRKEATDRRSESYAGRGGARATARYHRTPVCDLYCVGKGDRTRNPCTGRRRAGRKDSCVNKYSMNKLEAT